eukprot:c44726_g1_i1 orf=9-173(+)
MARNLIVGAKVFLCSSKEVVAFAIIHCVDPNASIHFKKIGFDKVALVVDGVLSP